MELKLDSTYAESVAKEMTKLSIEHGYLPKQPGPKETAEAIYELYNTLFVKFSEDD